MASDQKVYMPLMIGDWLKGTRGMRAEVRGVYLNLLLYQWDNGFIPSDMETLSLIDPEVGKVWVFIKDKFIDAGPGRLKNLKNDEVRDFWKKQSKNGQKGGRPKKEKPKPNPEVNPNNNPNNNLHNDLDLDYDIEEELKGAFDEIYLDQQKIKWPHLDFRFEYLTFCEKVRGSPAHYKNHDTGGLRLAFQSQLRNSKGKSNGNGTHKTTTGSAGTSALVEGFKQRLADQVKNGTIQPDQ